MYNETKAGCFLSVFAVALLAEGVDRNFCHADKTIADKPVALLAEGVDRNHPVFCRLFCTYVALLAEGVDRNYTCLCFAAACLVALLAEGVDRNAALTLAVLGAAVALLAEGVDRNDITQKVVSDSSGSPSSRRAWIEITTSIGMLYQGLGRPPRGGRG